MGLFLPIQSCISQCFIIQVVRSCFFHFHPRADAVFSPSPPLFFSYSSLTLFLPLSSPQLVTARIMTSQQSCFVGRLSEKKQLLTTTTLSPEPFIFSAMNDLRQSEERLEGQVQNKPANESSKLAADPPITLFLLLFSTLHLPNIIN